MSYAQHTDIAADRTRAEIEKLLTRHGATSFAYGWQEGMGSIVFELAGRRIRFLLPLPDRADREYTQRTPRSAADAERTWEQAVRSRWRALLLVIKAKLEAAESGIVSIESEFLSQTMLPDGRTVGEWVEAQIPEVYRRGQMPALLPGMPRAALGSGEECEPERSP
jgi:hypothetical protein